jgi:hypothetical protein
VSSSQNSQILPSEAYDVQMRLPDESATEYLLMQPRVPARCDDVSTDFGAGRVAVRDVVECAHDLF